MAPPIWYVHGAGASPRSFAWLSAELPEHEALLFRYDHAEGVSPCIQRLGREIAAVGRPGLVVGHSLGGLIAAGVADQRQVMGVATLCAPFGGVAGLSLLAMLRSEPLFRDLAPMNPALRGLRDKLERSGTPHLAIVATSGLPFIEQPNDGVVTVASQTALPGTAFHEVALNHFEVLLSDRTVALLRAFIGQFSI